MIAEEEVVGGGESTRARACVCGEWGEKERKFVNLRPYSVTPPSYISQGLPAKPFGVGLPDK